MANSTSFIGRAPQRAQPSDRGVDAGHARSRPLFQTRGRRQYAEAPEQSEDRLPAHLGRPMNGCSPSCRPARLMSLNNPSATSTDPTRAKYPQISVKSCRARGAQMTRRGSAMLATSLPDHVLDIEFRAKAGVQLAKADFDVGAQV